MTRVSQAFRNGISRSCLFCVSLTPISHFDLIIARLFGRSLNFMQAEWIDLIEEDRSGRVRWENSKLSANLRDSGEKDRWKPLPLIGRDARHGDPTPEGNAAIGWRISVYWRDDICFYHGIVESYNPDSGAYAFQISSSCMSSITRISQSVSKCCLSICILYCISYTLYYLLPFHGNVIFKSIIAGKPLYWEALCLDLKIPSLL